jgi:hypothetical protein
MDLSSILIRRQSTHLLHACQARLVVSFAPGAIQAQWLGLDPLGIWKPREGIEVKGNLALVAPRDQRGGAPGDAGREGSSRRGRNPQEAAARPKTPAVPPQAAKLEAGGQFDRREAVSEGRGPGRPSARGMRSRYVRILGAELSPAGGRRSAPPGRCVNGTAHGRRRRGREVGARGRDPLCWGRRRERRTEPAGWSRRGSAGRAGRAGVQG